MASNDLTRRRLLRASVVTAVGLSGCLGEESAIPTDTTSPSSHETASPSDETTTRTTAGDGSVAVETLTVAEYILYALAGTHPHVHRRANRQYVVVHLETSMSRDRLSDRLTLELDGESVPQADRQPYSWQHETVDLAFAVPKDETVEAGRVLLDRTAVATLSNATLDRLNAPPEFEVSDPSVSPEAVLTGDEIDATVEFSLSNVGEGTGEFGASLTGNYLSGSKTMTATLDAGANRVVSGTTPIIGDSDEVPIRLDWGSDEWTTEIPVVDETTSTETE